MDGQYPLLLAQHPRHIDVWTETPPTATHPGPEPCNHSVGFCTGYCEHADLWRTYMDLKH